MYFDFFFFFQAEDGIRDKLVTGVQTCALPISAVASLLFLPEDAQAGALPEASTDAFVREIDERGEGFTAAHDEWLALLTSQNPAAAQSPSFRTFFVGLSQTLRLAVALRRF